MMCKVDFFDHLMLTVVDVVHIGDNGEKLLIVESPLGYLQMYPKMLLVRWFSKGSDVRVILPVECELKKLPVITGYSAIGDALSLPADGESFSEPQKLQFTLLLQGADNGSVRASQLSIVPDFYKNSEECRSLTPAAVLEQFMVLSIVNDESNTAYSLKNTATFTVTYVRRVRLNKKTVIANVECGHAYVLF